MANVEKLWGAVRQARKAKARLSDMVTQEVSAVDRAANLRRFVVVKRNATQETNDMATETKKLALRLPPAAKQAIMDSLAQSLDKLTAIASMVGESAEDEAATVPEDLGVALRQCAEVITGIADQYAPTAADDAVGSPPPPATPEAAAAPPDPLAANALEAAKGLPAPQHDPLKLTPANDGLSLSPKTMNAVGMLSAAIGAEFVEAAKAGRKIAGNRYKKLSDLHSSLGTLLNELAFDEATGAGEETKAKKSLATSIAAASTESQKLDELLKLAKANQTQLAAHDAQLAKMNRVPEAPRAQPIDGGGAPEVRTKWPLDMSADLDARKKKAAG